MKTIFLFSVSRNSYRRYLFFRYASLIRLLILFLFTAFLKIFFDTLMATRAGDGESKVSGFQIIWKGWEKNEMPFSNNESIAFLLQSLSCFRKVSL